MAEVRKQTFADGSTSWLDHATQQAVEKLMRMKLDTTEIAKRWASGRRPSEPPG